jgi:Zn-dependent peptidase ImmA (M78 family)
MPLKAPYLPYEKLRKLASDFQTKYNPSSQIPVPIEDIVEFEFGMNIIPVPGLEAGFEIDSYITSDLQDICVDEDIYKSQESRYRFSLAHELSHRLLHADIFKQLSFKTVKEWKQMAGLIPEKEYSWIEIQAYNYAGLLLVPGPELKDAFLEACENAAAAGIELTTSDQARKVTFSHLGRQFNVSAPVIKKRLKFENLITD